MLARQQTLRRQIRWTSLTGKQTQEQGWECLAVHSKWGEKVAAHSYASDAGRLREESHSRLEIFNLGAREKVHVLYHLLLR